MRIDKRGLCPRLSIRNKKKRKRKRDSAKIANGTDRI